MEIVTPIEILRARQRLKALVWMTPCVRSAWLSEIVGCEVYLKLENLQHTGSFKLRGALNKLKRLASAPQPPRVLTVSAGNHGRAVAYGASLFGLTATVIVPRSAPQTKIEAIRRAGVELQLVGESYDEAESAARQLANDERFTFISPYNDPDVIAGQGTIALELLEQVPDLNTILVPVGGGGLLAGVALMAKALNPTIKMIGVQAERSPAMYESVRSGRLVMVEEKPTLADGLAGNIEAGSLTVPLICQHVDDIFLTSEESLSRAIVGLLAHEQLVVEGAGAAPVAALLTQPVAPGSKRIAAILSGRNIDFSVLRRLIRQNANQDRGAL
ncbi:MAG: pyridoxal-phosphate dependent enzyme [Acidobacteria bacterium]|nr:pyridoxal-phosphate dependent enzyme [Acidobacteriota bacterium]